MSNQGSDVDQKSSDESIKDDNITESDDESKDKKISGKKYGNSIVIILYLINSLKKFSLPVIIMHRRKIVRFTNGPRNLDIRLKGKSNSKVLANKCFQGLIYLIMISKIHNK